MILKLELQDLLLVVEEIGLWLFCWQLDCRSNKCRWLKVHAGNDGHF